MSNETVVKTEFLTKRYGDFTALDNLSFELQSGQILGFIGPNGAGKTTAIKILVGLIRPTSGTASISGVNCTLETRKIKRLVGYMPDTFGLYENMRVREYLDFFGAAFGIPRKERQKRMNTAMDMTGAGYMADMFVESLSHGMKQRVAMSRIMLHDPPVLILDEPANGLDPTARVEMREVLLKLAAAGKTLIVTSHILPELSRICNMVAIMTGGKLRAFGSLDQIMKQVRARRIIEIQLVRAADVSTIAERVATMKNVSDVHSAPAEAMVRFSTTTDETGLSLLLQQLMATGVSVAQFREVPQDLEDAFLSVSGQSEEVTNGTSATVESGAAK